jgi:hypothetical protein
MTLLKLRLTAVGMIVLRASRILGDALASGVSRHSWYAASKEAGFSSRNSYKLSALESVDIYNKSTYL